MKTFIGHARICDGTGSPCFDGGLLFDETGILEVVHGDETRPADRTIDARNQLVTPGFIDIHRHYDAMPFGTRNYGDAMLLQGITTSVVGNCGISMTPAPEDPAIRQSMYDYYEPVLGHIARGPVTYPAYRKALAEKPLPVHTLAMIGSGAVKIAVKGFSKSPFTDAEMEAAQNLIREAMEAGAPGVSLGIMYLPECYSSEDEFVRLLQPVGEYDGVITTHIRGEGDSLVESVREVISVAKKAGCALEISHFKSCGMKNWGKEIHKAIHLIEEARAEGQDVTCDFYPYDGGSTALTTMLPPHFVNGDLVSALEKLGTSAGVDQLRKELTWEWPGWDNYAISLGWDRILISGVILPEYRKMLGMNMQQAAERFGYTDAVALAAEMMHREQGKTAIINLSMAQEDIDTIARLPYSNLISDSIYADTETPHPRLYGAFPKFLREYVRERHILPLETAIAKMTSMPAARMRIRNRCVLQAGNAADILIFNPAVFRDEATYEQPAKFATGLAYSFISGQIAVQDGKVINDTLGKLL